MTCRLNYNWAHDFPKLAREAGFCFAEPSLSGPIDWTTLGSIDVDRIYKQHDFSSLETSMHHVLDGPLCGLLEARILDPSISKLFKIAQLSIQYLLFCKQLLDRSVTVLKCSLREATDEIRLLKRQSKIKDDTIFKYRKKTTRHLYSDIYIPSMQSAPSPAACNICGKTFLNVEFLNGHLARRHGNLQTDCDLEPSRESLVGKSSAVITAMKDNQLIDTVKMQLEIKQLKERLSNAEIIFSNNGIIGKSAKKPCISPRKSVTKCDKETTMDFLSVESTNIRPNVNIQMIKPIMLISKDSSTNTECKDFIEVSQADEMEDKYRNEIAKLKEEFDKNLETITHQIFSVEFNSKMEECENLWKERSEELQNRLECDRNALKKATNDIIDYKKLLESKEADLNKKIEEMGEKSVIKESLLPNQNKIPDTHENKSPKNKKEKLKHTYKLVERKQDCEENKPTSPLTTVPMFGYSTDLAASYKEYQKSAGILEIIKSVKDTAEIKPEIFFLNNDSLNVESISSNSRSRTETNPKILNVKQKSSKFCIENENNDDTKEPHNINADFVSKFNSESEMTDKSERNLKTIASIASKQIKSSIAKVILYKEGSAENIRRSENSKGASGRRGDGDSVKESIKYLTQDNLNDDDIDEEEDEGPIKIVAKPKTSMSSLQLRSVRSLRQALVDNPEECAAYRNFMLEDLKNKLWSLNIDPSSEGLLKANYIETVKTLLHERKLTQKKFTKHNESFLEIRKNLEKQLCLEVSNHLKSHIDEIITIVEPKTPIQWKLFEDNTTKPSQQKEYITKPVKHQECEEISKRNIIQSAVSAFKAKSLEMLPKNLSPKRLSPASIVWKRKDSTKFSETGQITRTNRSEGIQKVARHKGITDEYSVGIPDYSESVDNSGYFDDDSLVEFTAIDLSTRKLSQPVERLLKAPINEAESYEIKQFQRSPLAMSPISGTNTRSMYTEITSESELTEDKGNLLMNRTIDISPENLKVINPTSPELRSEFRDIKEKERILNEQLIARLHNDAVVIGKKKVIFDLDANTQKTLSSIVHSSQNDEHSDFEIPSIEDLPAGENMIHNASLNQHYKNIVSSTKQSPKISEISSILQTQMRFSHHRSTETEFMTEPKLENTKAICKNSNTGSSTSLNSSIFDGSKINLTQNGKAYDERKEVEQPVPKPRTVASKKNVLDDLELSDFSF